MNDNYVKLTNLETSYTMSRYTTPVGKWKISESFFIIPAKKPIWLHRKMAKLLLGWEWIGE